MYDRFGLLIGGAWVPPTQGQTYPVVDPATEELLGHAPQAGPDDVERAVAAAEDGLRIWRATSPWVRSDILRKISGLIMVRRDEIAGRITREIGKPLPQSQGEVQAAAEQFDWFADETRRIYGQIVESRQAGMRQFVQFEPVGIVAAFSPWNFPVVLAARKIAPALAAGCAVICRGAEEAPGAVMLLGECCREAGLPAGVLNILSGHPQSISAALMADERVRKISFTGSIPVGKMLAAEAAKTLKRVTMELGGHSPVLIDEGVDVDDVARAAATFKFRNAGQVCISPSRFYVAEPIADRFAQAFAAQARQIKIGNGLEPGIEMGPLATRRRLEAIEQLTGEAVAGGARVAAGGHRPPGFNRGFFFEPTVLQNVSDDMRVMQEEPFGPIAPITTFSRFDDALARANALEFGLAAYVFTRSMKRAYEAIDALQSGIVSVNGFVPAATELPFGGVKASGYGREGGSLGIRDYLEPKSINLILV